jgi:HSP20 family molecular chaperone IbpA
MILLRRGLRTQTVESSFELDVMVDLGRQPTTSRHRCLAPWRPPIDVFETGNGLVVRAEIGGLNTSEVQVLLGGDELILRGERDVVRSVGYRVYHESRVRYGRFEAAIRLPFAVDVDLATAKYSDGFLSIELPRLAATRLKTGEEHGVV